MLSKEQIAELRADKEAIERIHILLNQGQFTGQMYKNFEDAFKFLNKEYEKKMRALKEVDAEIAALWDKATGATTKEKAQTTGDEALSAAEVVNG